MTRVTYTADGGHYRVGGVGFDPGDTKDVDPGLAEYLAGVEDFDVENASTGDGEVHEEDAPPDVNEWADWSEDSWLELGYTQRADDVREGRVDDYLDAIEAAETSDTVLEAVEDRRSELEA